MRKTFRIGVFVTLAGAIAPPGFSPIHAQRRDAPPAGQTEPRKGPKQGEAEPRSAPKDGTPPAGNAPAERQPTRREPSAPRAGWRPPTRPGTRVFVGGYFDGFFQRLPLPPGGHEITLFLDGYQTVRQRLYLQPGATFKLHHTMAPLTAVHVSDPPSSAPPLPPPPVGTFVLPRSSSPLAPLPPTTDAAPRTPQGTLILRVQPSRATVLVDGESWTSSDNERFTLELAGGPHQLTVSKDGYQPMSMQVQILEGETTPVNVSLLRQ